MTFPTNSYLASSTNTYPNSLGRRITYPSPFFDLSSTYLPTSVRELHQWCEYYFLANPLANTVISKMAEYPVTDIIVEHDDPDMSKKWQEFLTEALELRAECISVGLDHYTFGVCYSSVLFPFEKELQCNACKKWFSASSIKPHWKFSNYKFSLQCPECGSRGYATVRDSYYKNVSKLKIHRWNPRNITISYNEITGRPQYYYKPGRTLVNDITLGIKDVIISTPQLYIEAIRKPENRIKIEPSNFYAMVRPGISSRTTGYGMPLLLPVLKDLFYLQTLKRAQEAIAMDHIVPLRAVFPQAPSASADPISTLNLQNWRREVKSELVNWRRDCVSPDTLVETARGLIKAGDVEEGDLLVDHIGAHTRINKIWERPLRDEEKAYKIHVRGLSAVESVYSSNHPIWAAKSCGPGHARLGPAEFIEVKDLRPNDYVGYPIPSLGKTPDLLDLSEHTNKACTKEFIYIDHSRGAATPEAFELLEVGTKSRKRKNLLKEYGWPEKVYEQAQNAIKHKRTLRRLPRFLQIDEEFSWVCGLYLAGGSTNSKQVLFALHKDETEYIDRLDRFFDERFGASGAISKKSEGGIQVSYSSVIAAQLFHSLCPGTAISKRVPKLFREGGREAVLALLSGLFAGDGCYHAIIDNRSKTTYTSASVQLAEDIRQLLLALGLVCGISINDEGGPRVIDGKECAASTSYTIQVSGNYDRLFRSMLLGTEPPKKLWANSGVFRDGYIWHQIRAIEEADTDTVIGFDVRSDTFCTWGVATHNSNYIPVLGFPLGHQQIGGDGRALLLAQEIQMWSDMIVAGLGIPRELVFGGTSWSGSNVSLRILENKFLNYITQLEQMVGFVIRKVAEYTGWPLPKVRFRPFKMADDLQRKMYLLQLNQAGKVSDKTLLEDSDLDSRTEDALMRDEAKRRTQVLADQQKAQAEMQGEAMITQAKYQQQVQEMQMEQAQEMGLAPGQEGGSPEEGPPAQPQQPAGQPQMTLQAVAERIAKQIQGMLPADATTYMAAIRAKHPDLAAVVTSLVEQQGAASAGQPQGEGMAPLPEQRPPRREASSV